MATILILLLSLLNIMIVMATSCCRRDMAMLLETLRAREGSDLEIKMVILSRMILTLSKIGMMRLDSYE